jgi:hypothetical protein
MLNSFIIRYDVNHKIFTMPSHSMFAQLVSLEVI